MFLDLFRLNIFFVALIFKIPHIAAAYPAERIWEPIVTSFLPGRGYLGTYC